MNLIEGTWSWFVCKALIPFYRTRTPTPSKDKHSYPLHGTIQRHNSTSDSRFFWRNDRSSSSWTIFYFIYLHYLINPITWASAPSKSQLLSIIKGTCCVTSYQAPTRFVLLWEKLWNGFFSAFSLLFADCDKPSFSLEFPRLSWVDGSVPKWVSGVDNLSCLTLDINLVLATKRRHLHIWAHSNQRMTWIKPVQGGLFSQRTYKGFQEESPRFTFLNSHVFVPVMSKSKKTCDRFLEFQFQRNMRNTQSPCFFLFKTYSPYDKQSSFMAKIRAWPI